MNNQAERKNNLARQRRHKHKDDFQKPYGKNFQGKEYVDYIRHIAIGSMEFTLGIIKHCRDGEVVSKYMKISSDELNSLELVLYI